LQRDGGVELVELRLGAAAEVEEEALVELLGQWRALGRRDLHLVPPRSDRGHQHASRVEVGVLVLVGECTDDPDLQPRLGQPLGDPLPPLDDGDRVLEGGVEIEVVELVDPAEPVGVDVHERRSRAQGRVHPSDHERRRGDVAADTEPVADPLGEGGLAGTELAAQHQQVAGPELPGQRAAQLAHRIGVGHVEQERPQRPAQLDVRWVAQDLAEPLPLPEPPRLRELFAGHHRQVVVPV
jgi:hypothetical protein